MKFLCDRCKTRYSIGDDRVRGKILKIRCKNCANVITVREGMTDAEAAPDPNGLPRRTAKPTTLAPPAQSPPPAPPPTPNGKPPSALEEEWYVSIDGEQSGPFSLQEAQRWISSKAPTADLHCWSEGFDDWLPVDKVSHFRGLRKKPAAPPAPSRATVAVAAIQVEAEEEPKPLFAATMAAIEKSVAQGPAAQPSPRATPLSGMPAFPAKVTNGSSPHAAIAPQLKKQSGPVPAIPAAATQRSTGPRPVLPTFDASDHADVPTQIEAMPFSAPARPMFDPQPLPHPMQPAPTMQPAPMFPHAFQPAPQLVPTAMPMPEPEPEGDIEIGEVSRVVNLADLARSAPKPGNNTGAVRKLAPRLRMTGSNSAFGDPLDALVAPPDAAFSANNSVAPAQPAARESHKKLYFLLGGVVLILLVIVGAVVYSVSRGGDDDATAMAHGREIDLSRPDDPQQRTGPVGKVDPTKDPATPLIPHHRPNVPYVPPIGKTPVIEPDSTDATALKAEDVEAMARSQSDATNRCYMRAQRGADAITIGDVKRINVTLTIDKEGAVSGVDLSDHANDTLGKCLLQRIKGWKFHPSNKGLTTRLTLVFQAT